MVKVAMVVGALVLGGVVSGAHGAERKLDAGSMAAANDTAAMAAAKADSGSGFGIGRSDVTNSQFASHDDTGALGAGKAAAIGMHSYSAAPDEGSLKKGVLNAKVELGALASDPQIGGDSKLGIGSANAAQQVDARDLMAK